MSCHGFIKIVLLLLNVFCGIRNVDGVMSSSDDCKYSLIWRLANLISLMSLFVVVSFFIKYIGSRVIFVLFVLSLVSYSLSEGFILND